MLKKAKISRVRVPLKNLASEDYPTLFNKELFACRDDEVRYFRVG
jgi:hypothetical protein